MWYPVFTGYHILFVKKRRIKTMETTGVRCEMLKDFLHISISGDIDHHGAKYIRDEIDKAIFYFRPKLSVLDLSEVSFMDSSGLGLILGRYTRMKEIGGELRILDPSKETEKIIRLAGLEKYIPIIKRQESKTK